jgi:hypothetical protein
LEIDSIHKSQFDDDSQGSFYDKESPKYTSAFTYAENTKYLEKHSQLPSTPLIKEGWYGKSKGVKQMFLKDGYIIQTCIITIKQMKKRLRSNQSGIKVGEIKYVRYDAIWVISSLLDFKEENQQCNI